MKSNHQIKKWIERVINSCNTWDQVTSAEKLVDNFKKQMVKNEYDRMLYLPITVDLDHRISLKRRDLVEGYNQILNN
jgi:hypothetical protein